MVVNAVEAALTNALVATVGGTRPLLSLAQITDHLHRYYNIDEQST
jgi:hypothetical protein